ncbi:MAG TPA: hydroxymethylbilane synthase [Segetibacter sp.]|jgi:hydroxymethylbilane synthase
MNKKLLRIGTRDSQLAVWQAKKVAELLAEHGYQTELIYLKSEGDVDLKTPLYEMNVQGIFTRTLDIALLNERIDIAVHSMKDVPTKLPEGIMQAAVLKRASYKDLLVYKGDISLLNDFNSAGVFATSSVRRKAQWLNRYPNHTIENLRGNVNTRMQKVAESNWNGAIFAAAGLDRIDLRPENSIELDWMLPAPSQGAIMVVCRTDDEYASKACANLNDEQAALCTKVEKDFLRTLLGGCTTPISALAEIENDELLFKGNILTVDGSSKVDIEKRVKISDVDHLGINAAIEILANGGQAIADTIPHER